MGSRRCLFVGVGSLLRGSVISLFEGCLSEYSEWSESTTKYFSRWSCEKEGANRRHSHLWSYEAGGRKKLNGNKSNRAVVWLTNSAHRFLMVCHSTVSLSLQASVDSLVKLSTVFVRV